MSVSIKPDQAYAYAEILEIISLTEKKYVNRIPQKLLDIFEENKSLEYISHLDPNISIEKQNISEKTSALLGMLMINYWYDSEEQKQNIINMFKENERKYQEELQEKYNPDNIFKNNTNQSIDSSPVEVSEDTAGTENQNNISNNLPMDYNSFSWYKKLYTKIRLWFYKVFKKSKNPT